MGKAKGRDGRRLRDVNIESEYLEVQRRRYHQRLRADRASRARREQTVEEALRSAAQQLREKGWKVNEEEE